MTETLETNFDGECDQCGNYHGNLVHFDTAGVYLCKECCERGVMA